MNNRFKFRLWDSDNDVFDYIDLTDIEETIRTLDSYENYFWSDYFKEKSEYIMQSTDLKDKNGKLIYEGDYIKNLKTNTIYKVFWEDKATCFMLKSTRFGGVVSTYTMFQEYPNDLEVIGNIYENEDLLKCENQ